MQQVSTLLEVKDAGGGGRGAEKVLPCLEWTIGVGITGEYWGTVTGEVGSLGYRGPHLLRGMGGGGAVNSVLNIT